MQADEAKPENGYFCEWMAYQVGQAAMSGDGPFETCRRSVKTSVYRGIVLQKSQNAVQLNFRQTTKQAATVDRCSLKRATEVASEFVTE